MVVRKLLGLVVDEVIDILEIGEAAERPFSCLT